MSRMLPINTLVKHVYERQLKKIEYDQVWHTHDYFNQRENILTQRRRKMNEIFLCLIIYLVQINHLICIGNITGIRNDNLFDENMTRNKAYYIFRPDVLQNIIRNRPLQSLQNKKKRNIHLFVSDVLIMRYICEYIYIKICFFRLLT